MPRRKPKVRKSTLRQSLNSADSFVLRYAEFEIHETAFKHGISELDIHHVCANSSDIFELDQESYEIKILIIGPGSAGNLLEVIGLEINDQSLLIIHAMKIRKSMVKLLEGRS
ncbi:MAG: hypothetical protein RIT00_592 [Actinomycetota bacterium]